MGCADCDDKGVTDMITSTTYSALFYDKSKRLPINVFAFVQ